MQDLVLFLPHVNAALNSLATLLLLLSFVAIKSGKESLHKSLMLAAFGVSAIFLMCYLTYHFNVPSRPFPVDDYAMGYAYAYWALLLSHVLLAISVPVLAIWSMILGFRGIGGDATGREKHRKLVRWAFPIWMYVSVTGVLVYLLLYWIFIPKA